MLARRGGPKPKPDLDLPKDPSARPSPSSQHVPPSSKQRLRPPRNVGQESNSTSLSSTPSGSTPQPTLPSGQASGSTARAHPSIPQTRTVDSEDEDDIDRTLMSLDKSSASVQKVNLNPLDTDSDLTPESESESEDEARTSRKRAGSNSALASGSSSSASPGPMGPKMLGKNAKTDVLAQYWGAPSGDRRSRRKSASNGSVSLLGVRKSKEEEGKKSRAIRGKHADNSDSDEEPALPKRGSRRILAPPSDQEEEEKPRSKSTAAVLQKHRKTSSMSDIASVTGQRPPGSSVQPSARTSNDRSLPEQRSGSLPKSTHGASVPRLASEERSRTSASAVAIPGLATSGTERTSESNLALFWSAGIGGGRTRRQAQREPQTMTPQPQLKRSRLSSESSRSRTPEVKRPRGRPLRQRDGENTMKQEGGQRHADVKGEEDMDVDEEEDSEEKSEDEDATNGSTVRPYMFPGLAARATQSGDPGHAASGTLLPSAPLMRPPAFIRPDLASAAARSNSPLAGSPPQGVRTGAPGQPIRRNLRWGSGKTSLSRPLGSVSPLGRPFTGASESPVQPRPLDGARQLQYASGYPDTKPPANGNHTSASAPPVVQAAFPSTPIDTPPPLPAPPAKHPDDSKEQPTVPAPLLVDAHVEEVHPCAKDVAPAVSGVKEEVTLDELGNGDVKMEEAIPSPRVEEHPVVDAQAKQLTPPAEQPTPAQAEASMPALSTPPPPPPPPEAKSPEMSTLSSTTSSPNGTSADALQRRVSGRARKPPEMAAGQIPYKGSLIKLAAQRAKGVKKPAGDGTETSPLRTPSKNRRSAASTSPLKNESGDAPVLQHRRGSDPIVPAPVESSDLKQLDEAQLYKAPGSDVLPTLQHLPKPLVTPPEQNGTITHEDNA